MTDTTIPPTRTRVWFTDDTDHEWLAEDYATHVRWREEAGAERHQIDDLMTWLARQPTEYLDAHRVGHADPATFEVARRVPSEAGERLASELVVTLERIRSIYGPLVDETARSLLSGSDPAVAEGLLADLDHIHDKVLSWLRTHGLRTITTADAAGDLIGGLVDTAVLRAVLDLITTAGPSWSAFLERAR